MKVKAEPFRFKQFTIAQDQCLMKVGTDGVLLGAWASVENAKHALDIGTGTGVIAIMIGQRTETTQIDAVEIDESSAGQARENMDVAPWSDRLIVHHISIQEYARECEQSYDLILSNPPFFTGGTFSDKEHRNNIRHTVKLPHGELLTAVRKLLKPAGRFSVILPYIEGLRFQEMAERYNLYCTRMREVHPKADKPVERLLLQFEKKPVELIREEPLIIQKEGRNEWTEAYRELTGDFYLKM